LRPAKKFKSVAPKGSKFTAGYTDRAKARQEAQDDEDDRAQRVQALEDQVKLGQLDRATFEALRDQIVGGDVGSTHLVKGLDRKLLERVRRGEDVLGTGHSSGQPDELVDVDEELEKLGEQEVETVKREQAEKKGVKAVPQLAGKKRTRDEIMAELKAQRHAAAAAKAAAAPALGDRWRKVGEQEKPKVEMDHKGREVVTVVNEDGSIKKMVRKAQQPTAARQSLAKPDASKPVLGADVAVPVQNKSEDEEESDEDIFAEAGTEYNPLGDVEDEDDEDEDEDSEGEEHTKPPTRTSAAERPPGPNEQDAEADVEKPRARRNYFGDGAKQQEDAERDRFKGVENVLKKAAKLGAERQAAGEDDEREGESKEEREARLARRKRMLQQQDRDLEDMDMGFGGSRMEDDEDVGDSKIKLAEWKGGKAGGDDGWEEDDGKGGGKKKRKPKKRKGDVNNAADIMRVIEGRKAGK
jgi:hypothetical protein